MSFALEDALSVIYAFQSPRDLALSYRGRRIELRQEYEKMENPVHKKFLEEALQEHTKLMIQNNKPLRSYLWKAEKNGNFVYLFGETQKLLHRAADFENVDEREDLTPMINTYFYPQILEAFESSEHLYVDGLDENLDFFSTLQRKYPKAFEVAHPQGNLYYDQFVQYDAELGWGTVELMLKIKAGTQTPVDFVIEMKSSGKTIEKVIELVHVGKIPSGCEMSLEAIDAAQVGNLHSLTLLHQSNPPELFPDYEARNISYTNYILHALEDGEKAFFAPEASFYIGETGILSLLEKEGVAITRIEMNSHYF